MKRAIFLDRDGTINSDDQGYINHPDHFKLYSFSGKAINLLNEAGYLVIIVTNQSGIARGYYTFEDINAIHAKMQSELALSNAHIDKIYLSPYHIEGHLPPWNINHEDRKPGLGMFKQAQADFKFLTSKSFMIGDRYGDILFGHRAGLKTILVLTGDGQEEYLQKRHKWEIQPDFIAHDLLSAAKLILTYFPYDQTGNSPLQ